MANDAFWWAVRLHEVSARHATGAAGFNAASDELDALLSGLSAEQVREVACMLALLPRLSMPVQPLLLERELARLRFAATVGLAGEWSS